jgi:hypothetical protein
MIRRVLLASEEPTAPVANGAAWQKVPITQELVIPPRQAAVKAHGSYGLGGMLV